MKIRDPLCCLAAAFALAAPAAAQDAVPLTFQMSWKAQAEHGGYHQAVARGFYADCGVDMTIRDGGPGMDTAQLLASGAVDVALISQNDGVMNLVAAGFPARAVMTSFQKVPQILMYHPGQGIETPADMKGHPVLLSQSNRVTIWPFLQAKYGLEDADLRAYNGQIAVWMTTPDAIQQGFVSSEPWRYEQETGEEASYFLIADMGYASAGSLVVVSEELIQTQPEAVQCLVDASVKGWQDFIADPAPAMESIAARDPNQTEGQMRFAIDKMISEHLLYETDPAEIGRIDPQDWAAHAEMLKSQGLLAADFDPATAYTLDFLTPATEG
ncbi:ABC transporter substrate-binding protein [Mangrovicoccus algicola]|uniref:ABC transporter substrate-binding protein n=1 Tax=Mangrovicoccus algicola TaxID=2771008 RepID=A0A8J6YUH0_9RHOB|nr:ABC transporter substrate-binding protein [Mangrovicoccus algicola]MBE3637997.1 ABC transporter substrate-binding protein [Mangrovicoccus algicola]